MSRRRLMPWAAARLRDGLPTGADLAALLGAGRHGADVTLTRTALIGARVYAAALFSGFLTLLWIAVDIAVFDNTVWLPLATGRLIAAAGFVAIAARRWDAAGLAGVLRGLMVTLGLALALFVYGLWVIAMAPAGVAGSPLVTAYLYMPFVVMTGFAVFPLTAGECARMGAAFLVAFGVTVLPIAFLNSPVLDGGDIAALLWLQVVMTMIASLAGMSQLHFLIAFTAHSTRDALTRLFTRGIGEEILALQMSAATRNNTPFALLFLDLDRFKEVNDRYGHEAGDELLSAAAGHLAGTLRSQDVAIRWGGEEFVVLMPNTTAEGALIAVERLGAAGIGMRPDGTAQTVSIGLAERIADGAVDGLQLVDVADTRMYAAKEGGRNQVIGPDRIARPFLPLPVPGLRAAS